MCFKVGALIIFVMTIYFRLAWIISNSISLSDVLTKSWVPKRLLTIIPPEATFLSPPLMVIFLFDYFSQFY